MRLDSELFENALDSVRERMVSQGKAGTVVEAGKICVTIDVCPQQPTPPVTRWHGGTACTGARVRYYRISVEDNGVGIANHLIAGYLGSLYGSSKTKKTKKGGNHVQKQGVFGVGAKAVVLYAAKCSPRGQASSSASSSSSSSSSSVVAAAATAAATASDGIHDRSFGAMIVETADMATGAPATVHRISYDYAAARFVVSRIAKSAGEGGAPDARMPMRGRTKVSVTALGTATGIRSVNAYFDDLSLLLALHQCTTEDNNGTWEEEWRLPITVQLTVPSSPQQRHRSAAKHGQLCASNSNDAAIECCVGRGSEVTNLTLPRGALLDHPRFRGCLAAARKRARLVQAQRARRARAVASGSRNILRSENSGSDTGVSGGESGSDGNGSDGSDGEEGRFVATGEARRRGVVRASCTAVLVPSSTSSASNAALHLVRATNGVPLLHRMGQECAITRAVQGLASCWSDMGLRVLWDQTAAQAPRPRWVMQTLHEPAQLRDLDHALDSSDDGEGGSGGRGIGGSDECRLDQNRALEADFVRHHPGFHAIHLLVDLCADGATPLPFCGLTKAAVKPLGPVVAATRTACARALRALKREHPRCFLSRQEVVSLRARSVNRPTEAAAVASLLIAARGDEGAPAAVRERARAILVEAGRRLRLGSPPPSNNQSLRLPKMLTSRGRSAEHDPSSCGGSGGATAAGLSPLSQRFAATGTVDRMASPPAPKRVSRARRRKRRRWARREDNADLLLAEALTAAMQRARARRAARPTSQPQAVVAVTGAPADGTAIADANANGDADADGHIGNTEHSFGTSCPPANPAKEWRRLEAFLRDPRRRRATEAAVRRYFAGRVEAEVDAEMSRARRQAARVLRARTRRSHSADGSDGSDPFANSGVRDMDDTDNNDNIGATDDDGSGNGSEHGFLNQQNHSSSGSEEGDQRQDIHHCSKSSEPNVAGRDKLTKFNVQPNRPYVDIVNVLDCGDNAGDDEGTKNGEEGESDNGDGNDDLADVATNFGNRDKTIHTLAPNTSPAGFTRKYRSYGLQNAGGDDTCWESAAEDFEVPWDEPSTRLSRLQRQGTPEALPCHERALRDGGADASSGGCGMADEYAKLRANGFGADRTNSFLDEHGDYCDGDGHFPEHFAAGASQSKCDSRPQTAVVCSASLDVLSFSLQARHRRPGAPFEVDGMPASAYSGSGDVHPRRRRPRRRRHRRSPEPKRDPARIGRIMAAALPGTKGTTAGECDEEEYDGGDEDQTGMNQSCECINSGDGDGTGALVCPQACCGAKPVVGGKRRRLLSSWPRLQSGIGYDCEPTRQRLH